MAGSVYRVTEVIGTSPDGWAEAAANAVETAAKSVRDLRIAEVVREDVAIEDGKVKQYRVRLAISFKYESSEWLVPEYVFGYGSLVEALEAGGAGARLRGYTRRRPGAHGKTPAPPRHKDHRGTPTGGR